jgi:hypothetical protein
VLWENIQTLLMQVSVMTVLRVLIHLQEAVHLQLANATPGLAG